MWRGYSSLSSSLLRSPPRHLGFHLQIDSFQFEWMGSPSQFLKFLSSASTSI